MKASYFHGRQNYVQETLVILKFSSIKENALLCVAEVSGVTMLLKNRHESTVHTVCSTECSSVLESRNPRCEQGLSEWWAKQGSQNCLCRAGRNSSPARAPFPNCDHFSCKPMLMWTIGGLTLKLWSVSLWMSKLCVLGKVSKSSKRHSYL